jgi:membrane carboxypeptidase/penicillin-binding protein PbpC
VLLWLALATAASAQEPTLPDRDTIIAQLGVDPTVAPREVVEQAIIVTQDKNFRAAGARASGLSLQIVARFAAVSRAQAIRPDTSPLVTDLEATFGRDEIVAIYSQIVPLGANCRGFDAALRTRLHVDPAQASLRDTLTLAVLIGAPDRVSADPATQRKRFEFAAELGAEEGFWNEKTRETLLTRGPTPVVMDAECP